jgi:hypothetical protein
MKKLLLSLLTSAALAGAAFANELDEGYKSGWVTGCQEWTSDSKELKGDALQKQALFHFDLEVENGRLPASAREQFLKGFISGYPKGYNGHCR